MATEDVAKENLERTERWAEKAAVICAKATVEFAGWGKEIVERLQAGAKSEEAVYHDKMDLDFMQLNAHVYKAQERGILSQDDVAELNILLRSLRSSEGLENSREACMQLHGILESYITADMKFRRGMPVKDAYRDIKKCPGMSLTQARKIISEIADALKRVQDKLREASADDRER